MSKTIVAVVRGERSPDTVREAIELAGGVYEFRDKPVLIKVNLISEKDYRTGAVTDPVVVEGIIQSLQKVTDKICVVESDATLTNAYKACRKSGIMEICEKYNVPFVNLRHCEKILVRVKDFEILPFVRLPKIVLNSYIVNAAKMKTHTDTKVSLGLKNMFGILPDKVKAKYHLLGIEKVLVDINSVVKASLTVIDGFIAMNGKGPLNGVPVNMSLVIAGKDPVATDAITAKIMGFDYTQIYHIKRCWEKKLGDLDNVEVVGEKIENVQRKFVLRNKDVASNL